MVSAWIAATQRAMPDLKALDKWPNIDGHIEITEKDGSPKGELRAQVKKLNPRLKNKLSFKNYKFLEHCRVSIDWTPIILIGVDLESKKAYWLHIDSHFLSQGGDRKTITFVENQVIKSGTSEFIKSWEKIIAIYYSKHREFEKNKKLFFMLSDVFNPAYGKTDQHFVNIHYFLDELNGYLDHTLPIVKQIFYPNTWKLGFAYFQYETSSLAYSLYPIAQNQNDVQIKEINRTLFNKIKRDGLGFSTLASRNPIKTNPKEYAKEVVHQKTSDIIKRRWLKHSGSEYLAKEFIFAFIDRFHIPMGLELKDKYSLEEIEKAIDTYLPLWLKFSHDLLLRKKREPEGTIMECKPSWIHSLSENECNEVAQNVEKVIQDDTFDFRIMLQREVETSLVQFWEFLDYLKKSRKRKVERLYGIERRSSSKCIDHNLKMFCEHLLEVYDAVIQTNFPMLKDELSLFGKADTILISRRVKDHPDALTDYWGNVSIYYLKANIKRTYAQPYLVTKEELERVKKSRVESKGTLGEVTFRNKKYQLIYISTDFIYEGTPMLNFIYEKLKQRMDEYFKETEPDTTFDKHSKADEAK